MKPEPVPEWVKTMSDEEIEARAKADQDNLPTTVEFWKDAHVVMPTGKTPVTFRMDNDVLAWFKGQGRNYQKRMNAVLRSYMDAHDKAR